VPCCTAAHSCPWGVAVHVIHNVPARYSVAWPIIWVASSSCIWNAPFRCGVFKPLYTTNSCQCLLTGSVVPAAAAPDSRGASLSSGTEAAPPCCLGSSSAEPPNTWARHEPTVQSCETKLKVVARNAHLQLSGDNHMWNAARLWKHDCCWSCQFCKRDLCREASAEQEWYGVPRTMKDAAMTTGPRLGFTCSRQGRTTAVCCSVAGSSAHQQP
jgi:hypothetical protein